MNTFSSVTATALATLAIPFSLHAGVIAHYPFDTGYLDTSGNSRDGTLTDIGTAGNSGITTAAGDWKFGGGAMNFSSDRDYVSIPSHTFSSGSSYTIAFWAKKTAGDTGSPAQWDMVIGQRDGTSHFIALNNADGNGARTGFRWRGSDSSSSRQADFVSTDDSAWHHYAIVATGTNVTFYLDGSAVSTATSKLTDFILDTIGEAYTSGSDFDFHGQIDEMWIFDEALSPSSVSLLQSTNTLVDPTGFAGFLQKYDGDYSDSSGQGNSGLPSGGVNITTLPADIVSGSGALSLDGAEGSYLALTEPGSFSDTEPWTIAWWARRGEIGAGKGMIAGKRDTAADFIWLNDSFNGLRFRSSTAATLDFTSPKDTELRHYALVADGAGSLSLYLNGQFSETLTGNTSISIDTIGDAYSNGALELNFQGILDEFHVTPASSSAAQIQAIYDAEKPEEEPATPTATRLRVVLIGGQSNADGRAAVGDLSSQFQSPQADVDFYYKTEGSPASLTTLRPGLSETNGFGPEIALGRHLADLHAGETGTRVALIKYANGGTNLHVQWKPGGDATTTGDGTEYVVFQQTVTSGLAALAAAYPGASIELQGMVWMQGESDISGNYSSFYQVDLTNFIADIRATYGADLPFIIGKLSSAQTALSASGLATVRAAQEAVAAADPRTAIISTDSYGMKSDNLHFDATGQLAMGRDFQEQTAYYQWMLGKFSSAEIDNGTGEPDFDADGDGRSNRAEFLAGTEPLVAGLFLQADFTTTGLTTGTVSYDTSANRNYAVERWDLTTGMWQTILPATPGTGGQVSRDLTISGPIGLYRVRIELP